MKKFFQVLQRTLHAGLLFLGFFAALATALQFTAVPQRVRAFLSEVPDPFSGPPPHILVMSGSRIGETGLARLFNGGEEPRLFRHGHGELLRTLFSTYFLRVFEKL